MHAKTIATALLLTSLAGWAAGQTRYMVRMPESAARAVAARHGATLVKSLSTNGRDVHVLSVPAGAAGARAAAELAADPQVRGVELDGVVGLPERISSLMGQTAAPVQAALSNRTVADYYGTQAWGAYVYQPAALITNLHIAHTFGGGSGTVAILDTGVDFSHPVLAGSLVPGFDFTRGGGTGSEMADLDQSTTAILDQSTTAILDKNRAVALNQSTTAILDQSTTAILDRNRLPAAFGHGTMVAGLVHLAAPRARLMPVKVFGGDGTAELSRIVEGIYYAVDHGAKVINMSFSAPESSVELARAIEYANSRRVTCVASVGNDGRDVVVYPAGLPQTIGVASVGTTGARSAFSNYGRAVTLAAPGEGNITVFPGKNYAAVWGTSFSTPLVAGTVALLAGIDPNVNAAQAKQSLSEAVYAGPGLGAGRLDAFLACLHRALRGRN